MREQKAGRQTGLRVLPRHANDRPTGACRVVVDETDQIFLPIEQLELLADELPLGNEANGLNELNNIRRANRIIRRSPPPSRHPSPLSPTVANPEPVRFVGRPHATPCANAAWRATGSKDRRRSWPPLHAGQRGRRPPRHRPVAELATAAAEVPAVPRPRPAPRGGGG